MIEYQSYWALPGKNKYRQELFQKECCGENSVFEFDMNNQRISV